MATNSSVLSFSLFLLIFSQVIINESKSIKFTDCSSGKQADAVLESVLVSDCENEPICSFVRGKNASIEVDFKTRKSFQSALVEIYGKIGHVPIPFVIKPDNACGNYGFDCPVAADKEEKLKVSLPVLRTYPKLSITVQLYLADEKRRPIICIEFPARIVDDSQVFQDNFSYQTIMSE